eukprot:11158621-Lingulodinium_polyedra.AAC.1
MSRSTMCLMLLQISCVYPCVSKVSSPSHGRCRRLPSHVRCRVLGRDEFRQAILQCFLIRVRAQATAFSTPCF